MPFGVIRFGFSGYDWGAKFHALVHEHLPQEADYLFVGSYLLFRQTLNSVLLPSPLTPPWTGHSLKATLLTWAEGLGLPDRERQAQGHHAPVHRCMVLYGRDDVLPQLRLQIRIMSFLCRGWRPQRILARGSRAPGVEPPVPEGAIVASVPPSLLALLPESFNFTPLPAPSGDTSSSEPPAEQEEVASTDSADSSSVADSSDRENADVDLAAIVHFTRPVVRSSRGTLHAAERHGEVWTPLCGLASALHLVTSGPLGRICRHAACRSRLV